jgi:hypothetical protein
MRGSDADSTKLRSGDDDTGESKGVLPLGGLSDADSSRNLASTRTMSVRLWKGFPDATRSGTLRRQRARQSNLCFKLGGDLGR